MRFIPRLAQAQLVLAMIALMVMGAVTVADVFLKYAFNRPIVGAYDLVESLLPVVIFHGLPATLLRRQNITIDLIDGFAGPRNTAILIRLADLIILILLVLMVWAMTYAANQAFEYGDRKLELGLSLAVVWAFALTGMAGAILAGIYVLFERRKEAAT